MDDSLEKASALQKASIFKSLPEEELLPVANLCTVVTLDPDADSNDLNLGPGVLFEQGDLGDAMYVVVSGVVHVHRNGERIATLGPGECVGEMASLDWNPRCATVSTDEPTVLIRIDRHDLLDLLVVHPVLAENLAGVLVTRVRGSRR